MLLPIQVAITAGLLVPFFIAPIWAASLTYNLNRLQPRITTEHVVLSDCVDQDGVESSQMAYYPATPNHYPGDICVMDTSPGETYPWVGSNTTCIFRTTVFFNTDLSTEIAQDGYGGPAWNNYTDFNCYYQPQANLYTRSGVTCAQVYDCHHKEPPANPVFTSIPATAAISYITRLTATSTIQTTGMGTITYTDPTATATDDSVNNNQEHTEGGLSEGALIGIVVSVVGTIAALLAAAIVFCCWRRSRRRHVVKPPKPPVTDLSGTTEYAHTDMIKSHDGSPIYELDANLSRTELATESGKAEVDGRDCRFEMGEDSGKYEMDGQPGGLDDDDDDDDNDKTAGAESSSNGKDEKAVSMDDDKKISTDRDDVEQKAPASTDEKVDFAVESKSLASIKRPKATVSEEAEAQLKFDVGWRQKPADNDSVSPGSPSSLVSPISSTSPFSPWVPWTAWNPEAQPLDENNEWPTTAQHSKEKDK